MEPIAHRFTPIRTLGQGAMGAVLLVHDGVSGRDVALKVISGALAEKSVLQFKQEFRQMTQLRHPHCCEVYDYGQTPDGAPYFTMEVVPGHGLDERLPLDEATFRRVFAQLLLALGYVHQLGFVHLDIKGANVRVRMDGTVKLMDFGLMERAGQPLPAIRGTVPYLAPEVIKRAPVDGRTDLYSAGALAYELLTGRPPFVADKPMEVLRAHLDQRPAPMVGVSPDLAKIVAKLLAKEPLERFASAADVLEALGYEAPPGIGGSLLSSPMVGRGAELDELRARLAEVAAGRPVAPYWLAGEPGVGKSRLLDEFRCLAQLENVAFVRAASHEHGPAPYGLLAAILRALMPALESQVPGRLAVEAPVLVTLLPELGVAPAPPMDAPRSEMLRLHAAAAGLLGELASRQPLVLLLEDWRGADAPTREFLGYFLRKLGEAPILLIASTRRGAETAGGPEGLAPVVLAGLPPPALAPMLENMLGMRPVPPEFVAHVADLTGGNPYQVERLLEDLVMAGRLARTGGRWDLAIAWDDVVLREKPLALPSGALLAARAVAIFGAPMALDDLQAITGLADEPLFEALDVLARDQVLAADDEGRYWFTRREVAGRVGAEMPGDVRIGLHATVLARLEARLAGRALSEAPIELVTALATHALAVPEAAGAMGYCLAAARRALALFALADGTRFVEAGLPLAERAGDRAARLAFLQLAADLKRYAGEHEAALQALEAAVPLATELGEQRVLGALLATQALVCLSSSRHDQAQERARQAAEVCLAAADPAGAARALAADARASFFRGRVDEAKATGARALELAQQGESRNVLAQVLAYLGYLYVASEPDKLEEGIGYLRRAVALLEELGDRVRLNDAHILLGNAELTLGNFETARTSFETCLAIAREHGIGEDEVLALVNLATADLELGRAAEARKVAEEARTKGEALDIRLPLGMAIALEAAAAARLGKLADVDARFGEALALANQIGNKYLEATILPYQLETLEHLGRTAEAVAAGERLRELIRETGNTEPEGRLDVVSACLAVRRRDDVQADAALERAFATARATKAKALWCQAMVAKARRAYAREDWEGCHGSAREALETARAGGYGFLAGELLALAGNAALAGGLGQAAASFAELAEVAAATGCDLHAALAAFGQAAADPYGPDAAGRAARARELLSGFCADLQGERLEAFLSFPERGRILAGNYIEASLPAPRKPAAKPTTGPLGLRFGGPGPL